MKNSLEIPVYVIKKGSHRTVAALGLDGINLAQDFFDALKADNPKGFQILLGQITLVAESPNIPRNSSVFKPLDQSRQLYEFKTRFGLRLYCFVDGGAVVILTNGGGKGSRQSRDIARAMELQDKFLAMKAQGAKVKLIDPDPPKK